jgi:hypothetical protein
MKGETLAPDYLVKNMITGEIGAEFDACELAMAEKLAHILRRNDGTENGRGWTVIDLNRGHLPVPS